jgi:DNA polymerase-4
MFVRCDASILHADLDSFYASVEQRDDPTLRGRPVIVGGGVVLAASYEAKAYGVRTAMGGSQARRLCPQAVVVPPRMSAYSRASDAVFEVFRDCSPIVEALSVDEAFLDVGGLRRVGGTPVAIAERLRTDVRDRVGLPITVGVARTKFLAKVASQEAKPDGLLLVPPDQELTFLRPLPVRRLWGVGAVTAEKLRAHGIVTVADVAELSESALGSMVGGAMGRQLYALSRNIDRRRVTTGVRRRSVGAQRALGRAGNTMSPNEIDAVVVNLIDRITGRMRAAGRTGRTVVLRLRFADFTRVTRSHTLPWATSSTAPLLAAARRLVADATPLIAQRGLTLVGFAVSGIDLSGSQQLMLPFGEPKHRVPGDDIDAAIDRVRRRYGKSALTPAVLLRRDPGFEMPHLPD